jgi:hypothetical protein
MSSGGDEPVADAGAVGHSVFAGALLQSLNDMQDDVFTAEALLSQRVQPRVAGRSQQTPQYAMIRDSDGDLGDFVFFRSKSSNRGSPAVKTESAIGQQTASRQSSGPPASPESARLAPPPAAAIGSRPCDSPDFGATTGIGGIPPGEGSYSRTQANPCPVNNSRFQIAGPTDAEIVVDTKTGLMWTKNDYWNLEKTFASNWNDAISWAKRLDKTGYGGYKDWVVPTIAQYRTLNASTADREVYLQVFQKTAATDFWASDTPSPSLASYISFTEGYAVSGSKTDPGQAKQLGRPPLPISVRLVRIAQSK